MYPQNALEFGRGFGRVVNVHVPVVHVEGADGLCSLSTAHRHNAIAWRYGGKYFACAENAMRRDTGIDAQIPQRLVQRLVANKQPGAGRQLSEGEPDRE